MARRNRKGRRSLSQVSIGVISVSRKGYAFVDTPEGEYFVLRQYLRGAMDGDVVEIARLRSLEARRQRQAQALEGRQPHSGGWQGSPGRRDMLGGVRRVLERAHETIVGTVLLEGGLGVVRPHDERIVYDIFLDNQNARGKKVKEGDVVVVRLTTYPGRLEAAQGYVEEVVGREDDRSLGIEVIIREHGLETVFSAAALEEAEQLAEVGLEGLGELGESGGLARRDLRERFVFTIDPADARDFDDALSVDFIDGQMLLGVHIADVSAYVGWESALDLNARRRATSTYLPDRVIPMLPPRISDMLCSLRPGEDKAAFTVDMLMHANGTVISTQFYPSLIRSNLRLNYDEVLELLEKEKEGASASTDRPLLTKLLALKRLSKKLMRRRLQKGAIEFESVEAKVSLDTVGAVSQVRLRSKNDATSLVEEAMILANEQVASFMLRRGAPMVYRIHDEPYPAALEELVPTLQEFGYAKQGAPQTSQEIQAILEASAKSPEHHLISTLLLRAMKRARYSSVFTTHFGLACDAYTHFTSPIRRYPDLMAHRLLTYQLTGDALPENMVKQLDWICEHSSDREREAEQASCEATALKLCEFLEPRIGDVFSGIVTSLNSSGFAVREDSTTAEGFVGRESLAGGFLFDMKGHRYHDPATRRSFRLGQPVRVTLIGVDLKRAKLQFVIA